jgi:hypothetical protein
MTYKTFGTLKTKIQRETDTEDEEFVTADEIKDYFQEAVDECAAQIYKIWPLACQYFEKLTKYDLEVGQQNVTLPSDMYARAITRLVFKGNGKVFTVRRMKQNRRYELMAQIDQDGDQGDYYMYYFDNASSAVQQLQLWPTSKDEGEDILWMWYVRQPIQIVDDDSKIDVPEFYYYITSYVKWKIYDKEGSVKAVDAKVELEKNKALMLSTLDEMTPDEDNLIESDTSAYEEHT